MTLNTPVASTCMTFDDEFNTFNSSTSGSSGWMTAYPYQGEAAYTLAANSEAEYYGDASTGKNPFSLQNGVLSITATHADGSNPYGLPYNSGVITTAKDFSQTYGYFEVRAELPAGRGLWPAFWLLPASINYTSELDVFEQLGDGPATIYSTTHGQTNGSWTVNSQAFKVADTTTGFHTYGVDWEASTTTYYVDGLALGSAPTPSSMNDPMFMLLNLAVGGNGSWPGSPDGSTAFPASMQIDWVHVFATSGTTFVGGSAALPATPITGPTPTPMVPPAPPAPPATGTAQTLLLNVAEDAWNGDAQYQVTVDGINAGGVRTATASHAAGNSDSVIITGTWSAGAHVVGVNFLNDAHGDAASQDRNLFVNGVSIGSVAASGTPAALWSAGNMSFLVPAGVASAPVVPASPFTSQALIIGISEDAWAGDAQYQISVDGTAVGGIRTASAAHATGASESVTLPGSWTTGAHSVSVTFLNDAYGGNALSDRNLYVDAVSLRGVAAAGAPAALLGSGTVSFAVAASTAAAPTPPAVAPPTTPVVPITPTGANQTLTVQASEDAWNGDAQYQLTVDGKVAGEIQTVTASHAAGLSTTSTVTGNWGGGTHSVGVNFLNDAYGGSSAMDRNLYIQSVSIDGTASLNGNAALLGGGIKTFMIPAGLFQPLTINLSEDAYAGNAQFTLAVDGQALGGVGSVTTLHASGNVQAFTNNIMLSAGSHDVAVSFINDAYGGSAALDRNLFINSASYGGIAIGGVATALYANGTSHFSVLVPST